MPKPKKQRKSSRPGEYLKAHQKVLELQKNLNDLAFQKQELESKLISLQQKMEMQGKPIYTPSVGPTRQAQRNQVCQKYSAKYAKKRRTADCARISERYYRHY